MIRAWLSSFRLRLTLWYVLVLALILALFSIAVYLMLDNSLDGRLDDELRVAAAQVSESVRFDGNQPSLGSGEGDADLTALADRGFLVRLLGSNAAIISSTGSLRSVPVTQAATLAGHGAQPFFDEAATATGNVPVRLYTVPLIQVGQLRGYIQLGESLGDISATLRGLLLALAVAVPLTLILASAGGLFLANRALAPIDKITGAARSIGASNLTQRLNLPLPDDELGRLARTFDAMLARLDDAFRRQRQFTADASHELRTPLAIIKGDIGVALNRQRSPAEYSAILGSVEEEVDRLTRLVDDLLLLARADSGAASMHAEPLALAGLLEVVSEQVQPLLEAKAQQLQLDVPGDLTVHGDTDKLLRLFLNLLDNAVKYTPEQGRICIAACADGGHEAVVEVADSGPGIPAEQLEQIFERFRRADSGRTRAEGGWGLGLAIARSIAEAHGGALTARSNDGHGSVFIVRLPLDGPAEQGDAAEQQSSG